ncbi:MAG: hypothetical protein ABIJ59_05735 [Pseudomonadota bacterium]
MNKPYLLSRFLIFILFILFFSGCAPLRPQTDPEMDKEALRLSHQAQSFNQHITTSKGTGWARLETKDGTITYKIAWAAVYPNKIRMTFLMFAQPIETIIATGKKVTFFSHTGKHAKRSIESPDPDMENYINVPIKMSEIIAILLGRLPIKPYDDAYFSPSDNALSVVTLHQNLVGSVQVINFDNNQTIDQVSSIDSRGKRLYDYNILAFKSYDFGKLPVKIQFIDTKRQKLTLTITGFVVNPEVKDSVFMLTDQGS